MKTSRIHWGCILVISLVFLVVYNKWLFNLQIIAQGDWGFHHIESLAKVRINYFSLWFSDFTFGRPLIDVSQAPTYALYGFLARFLGLNFAIAERFIHLFPIVILTPLSFSLLANHFFRNGLATAVATIIYSFNTYFLILQTGHITLMTAYALIPFAFLSFIYVLEKEEIKYIPITALSLFAIASYETRVFYIAVWILFFYYLFQVSKLIHDKRKLFKVSLLAGTSIALTFLLCFFWVLGLLNLDLLKDNEIFSRGLFGSSYFNILYSLALSHPFWTGGEYTAFEVQPIKLGFWLVPILAVAAVLTRPKNTTVLFFAFLALLGIFLTKQEGQPFVNAYAWLYKNFPGFNAFREASKFYYLIGVSYAVLVGFYFESLVAAIYKRDIKFFCQISLVVTAVVLSLWNTKSLVSGSMNKLFLPRTVPEEYLSFKKFLLKEQEFSRTLWVPRDSKWGVYTDLHPRISLVSLLNGDLKWLNLTSSGRAKIQDKLTKLFRLNFSEELFADGMVKYVVVPSKEKIDEDDFFIHYGGREMSDIREWYVSELGKIEFLERVNDEAEELAIFKIKQRNSYIDTLNSLVSFPSKERLEGKYEMIATGLDHEFDFTASKNRSFFPSISVTELFDPLEPREISVNNISSVNYTKQPSLLENVGEKDLSYTWWGGTLRIFAAPEGKLNLIGHILPLNTAGRTIVHEMPMPTFGVMYIKIGKKIVTLQPTPKEKRIGRLSGSANLLSRNGKNLISNASFESGLWTEKVGNCNAYDANPILGMKLTGNEEGEGKYLELHATRHFACTNQNRIPVQAGREYLFTFDYQSSNGKQAGYYLSFNDVFGRVISERIPVTSDEWNTYQKLIRIPEGATEMNLVVYSYALGDEKTNVITRYDNFSLFELTAIETIEYRQSPIYVNAPLPDRKEYSFTFNDYEHDFSNYIVNPSFEEGLWQPNVGDCNAYDAEPVLGMELAENTSHGEKSLELQATRHIACTGPGVLPVKGGAVYLLAFDYQSPNAKQAGYYIGFNDEEETKISERIPIVDEGWNNFTRQINVPEDATSASLVVYSYAEDGTKNVINRYDNFYFIELPHIQNRYYLVSDPGVTFERPDAVEFELINPTKKRVHVRGATTPFYLAMSESYHDQWQLQFANEKIRGVLQGWVPFVESDRVPDEHHFELNGFLNGWYVDVNKYCGESPLPAGGGLGEGFANAQNPLPLAPSQREGENSMNTLCTKNPDGSYDMEFIIEFFPQRWFYFGLLISGITFAGCIGYLSYEGIKALRRKRFTYTHV